MEGVSDTAVKPGNVRKQSVLSLNFYFDVIAVENL